MSEEKKHVYLTSFDPGDQYMVHFKMGWCVYIDDVYVGELYKTKDGRWSHRISLVTYDTWPSGLYNEIKRCAEERECEEILIGRWV